MGATAFLWWVGRWTQDEKTDRERETLEEVTLLGERAAAKALLSFSHPARPLGNVGIITDAAWETAARNVRSFVFQMADYHFPIAV